MTVFSLQYRSVDQCVIECLAQIYMSSMSLNQWCSEYNTAEINTADLKYRMQSVASESLCCQCHNLSWCTSILYTQIQARNLYHTYARNTHTNAFTNALTVHWWKTWWNYLLFAWSLLLCHIARERYTHTHRHSITHMHGRIRSMWLGSNDLGFSKQHGTAFSIRNNAGLTHRCTHTTDTQIHTHTRAAPPQQKWTHAHTSWPFNNGKGRGEGDEEGVREMESEKTQNKRGRESIGAAIRQSTKRPPPTGNSL